MGTFFELEQRLQSATAAAAQPPGDAPPQVRLERLAQANTS